MAETYLDWGDGTTKLVRRQLARLPEVQGELKGAARNIQLQAQAILAGHRRDGHATITMEKGSKTDWYIHLDDSEGGNAAAWAIEMGTWRSDAVAPLRSGAALSYTRRPVSKRRRK